jgi:hypothetical protein
MWRREYLPLVAKTDGPDGTRSYPLRPGIVVHHGIGWPEHQRAFLDFGGLQRDCDRDHAGLDRRFRDHGIGHEILLVINLWVLLLGGNRAIEDRLLSDPSGDLSRRIPPLNAEGDEVRPRQSKITRYWRNVTVEAAAARLLAEVAPELIDVPRTGWIGPIESR